MNTDKTDPICWMQWTIPKHDHWFCSTRCVNVYEQKEQTEEWSSSDNKWIAYVLIAVILLWGLLSRRYWVMIQFMWRFFVVVSLLKLLDLQWFVEAYAQYDIIAMKNKTRWWLYPFIELVIWISFLLTVYFSIPWLIQIIAFTTLILMVIWTIWVWKKLMKNEKFQCACLWTKLNIPLTNLTLVEDILMWCMSLLILIG